MARWHLQKAKAENAQAGSTSPAGAQKKRLIQVKGRRNIFVREVELTPLSMNSGDVFILDIGTKLYQVPFGFTSSEPMALRARRDLRNNKTVSGAVWRPTEWSAVGGSMWPRRSKTRSTSAALPSSAWVRIVLLFSSSLRPVRRSIF